MEPHGLQGHLELQIHSMESPMGIVLLWQLVGRGLSLLLQMGPHGLKELLGLPEDAMTMALIPLGYPSKGKWSQPKRRRVEDVTHWEHWNVHKQR